MTIAEQQHLIFFTSSPFCTCHYFLHFAIPNLSTLHSRQSTGQSWSLPCKTCYLAESPDVTPHVFIVMRERYGMVWKVNLL